MKKLKLFIISLFSKNKSNERGLTITIKINFVDVESKKVDNDENYNRKFSDRNNQTTSDNVRVKSVVKPLKRRSLDDWFNSQFMPSGYGI